MEMSAVSSSRQVYQWFGDKILGHGSRKCQTD
jgi:hypothetical protein